MEPMNHNLPGDAALRGMMDELDKAVANMPATQQRMMSLTGVAWSPDGMVKAEVGPRGQLVDLEIDPRAFRRADAQALKGSILTAVNAAVQEVHGQLQEMIFGQLPPEVAELRAQFAPEGEDPVAQMLRTDADLAAERRRKDG